MTNRTNMARTGWSRFTFSMWSALVLPWKICRIKKKQSYWEILIKNSNFESSELAWLGEIWEDIKDLKLILSLNDENILNSKVRLLIAWVTNREWGAIILLGGFIEDDSYILRVIVIHIFLFVWLYLVSYKRHKQSVHHIACLIYLVRSIFLVCYPILFVQWGLDFVFRDVVGIVQSWSLCSYCANSSTHWKLNLMISGIWIFISTVPANVF